MGETQKNMTDGTPPNSGSNTPPTPPQQPPAGSRDASHRRVHYDYSRSAGNGSDSHWYSWPGNTDPLAGQKANSNYAPHQPPPIPSAGPYRQPSHLPQRSTGSRSRQRANQRQGRRSGSQQNWAWAIIAIALLGMTIITSMILIVVLRSDGDKNNAFANQNLIEPTSIIYSNPELGGGDGVGGALEGNSLLIEPWDGKDRLTVLVMGMDNRPGEEQVVCRTDTIMVISIDPVDKTIGILSIPRDTYVEVPNYGLERINTACVLGNLERPGYGPQLAMQTVQYNFGIRINDYIMVDFNAFISLIDRIGGIDINSIQDINDPKYPSMDYGYDPFYLPAGEHHLDGATALKYARSRHNSDDIDRQRRQQEIIFAVRERVVQLNMVDDLALQAPGIWNDISDGINTSLSLDQIVRLGLFAKDISSENIHKGVVSWEYLFSYRTPTGGQVVVPRRAALGDLMIQVFGQNYNQ